MLNVKKTLTKILTYIGGLKFYDSNVNQWSTVEAKVLLWTNAAPNSSFPSQKVNIDLSGFDAVIVKGKANIGDDSSFTLDNYTPIGESNRVISIFNKKYFRSMDTSSSGIQFGAGKMAEPGAWAVDNNGYGIPLKIYGIKEN